MAVARITGVNTAFFDLLSVKELRITSVKL